MKSLQKAKLNMRNFKKQMNKAIAKETEVATNQEVQEVATNPFFKQTELELESFTIAFNPSSFPLQLQSFVPPGRFYL